MSRRAYSSAVERGFRLLISFGLAIRASGGMVFANRMIFYNDSRRKLSSRNDKAILYKIKNVTGGLIENRKIEMKKTGF
jgi:hypothetical protein